MPLYAKAYTYASGYTFRLERIYIPVYAVDNFDFADFSRLGLWITLWMVWMDMQNNPFFMRMHIHPALAYANEAPFWNDSRPVKCAAEIGGVRFHFMQSPTVYSIG